MESLVTALVIWLLLIDPITKVPIFPREPQSIIFVIVVNLGFFGALASKVTRYVAMLAVMVPTGIIMCLSVSAEG